MSTQPAGAIRKSKPLTFNRLIRATCKRFGLRNDYYPTIDIRIGYTGQIEIHNVSDINQATPEQIEFMINHIKVSGGLIQRGEGRESIVWND
jgi:hypothetical protein